MKCPHCSQDIDIKIVSAGPAKTTKSTQVAVSGDIGDMLQSIDSSQLNPFESEFVSGLRERYAQYGERTKMSEKQMGVLCKIAAEKAF